MNGLEVIFRAKLMMNGLEHLLEKECAGCGRDFTSIVLEEDLNYDELEDLGVTTNSGAWFCHEDCLRDQGGATRWGGV